MFRRALLLFWNWEGNDVIRTTRIELHSTALLLLITSGVVLCAIPAAGQTTLTLTRSVAGTGEYTPGETLDITVTFSRNGADLVTQLGLEETLPSGWQFQTLVNGDLPQIPPASGATGLLNFAYVIPPTVYPASFTYRITVPPASAGTKSISGRGVYAAGADQTYTNVATTEIPSSGNIEGAIEGEGEGPAEGEGEGEGEEVPTELTLNRTVLGPGTYPESGGTIDVEIVITRTGTEPLTQLGLTSVIPDGWTFNRLLSGALPPIAPTSGQSGTLSFAWITLPAFPITFSYRLNVPEASNGLQTISGILIFATGGAQQYSDNIVTNIGEGSNPEGEGEGEGTTEGTAEGTAEGTVEGEGEGDADTAVVLGRTPANEGIYTPGGTLDITITLNYTGPDTVSVLGLEETIPTGWTFVRGVSGQLPPIMPAEGAQGVLGFAWLTVPAFPVSFVYRLRTPEDASGPQFVTGEGIYSFGGSQLRTNNISTMLSEGSAEGEGMTEGEGAREGEGEGLLEGEGGIEGMPEAELNGLVMTRQILEDGFVPGGTLRIRVTFYYSEPDPVTALAVEETLPPGWTFNALLAGSLPAIFPQPGAQSPFSFAWLFVPAFPATFVYRVNVPPDASGPQQITGHATYYTSAEAMYSEEVVSPLEQGTGEGALEGEGEGLLEGEGEGLLEGEGEGLLEGEGETGPVRLTLRPTTGNWYAPGTAMDLTAALAYPGYTEITALALAITIPEGWTYDAVVAGAAPPVTPAQNSTGELGFAWLFVPLDRTSFTLRLNIPETAAGAQTITGVGLYRTTGEQITSNTVTLIMNELGLADLTPDQLEAPASAWAGQKITAAYRVANPGANIASAPWDDCFYLSEDDQPGGDLLLACVTHAENAAIGGTYEGTASLTLPEDASGTYWLILATDGGGALEESDEDNNTLAAGPLQIETIDYRATVAADIDEAPAGTPITFSGTVTSLANDSPVPDVPIVIEIVHAGIPEFLQTTANPLGQFSIVYEPLPTQAGTFTVGARHPGETAAPAQDNYVLHGLLITQNETVINLAPGLERTAEFVLQNLGDMPLSGLIAQLQGLPGNITAVPMLVSTLEGGESAVCAVTFTAQDNNTAAANASITITSEQNAQATADFALSVPAATPTIKVSSSLLRTGVQPGGQTLFQFEVTNTGGAPATDFSVNIPASLTWISVAAPAQLIDIAPGAVIPVTLQLLPPLALPLGQTQTTLEFRYGAAATMQVPFRVTVTEQATGTIQVTVVDEFRKLSPEAAPVSGALLALIDPETNLVEASGISNAQGRVDFAGIAQGLHYLQASSPQHGRAMQTIIVTPGGYHEVELALKRNFARHEWFANATAADQYAYSSVAYIGETGDAPVITVNPPVIDLRDMRENTREIFVLIANSGAQTAKNAHFAFGEDGRFRLTPVVSELGDIAPGESLNVPVWIEDTAFGAAATDQDCRPGQPSGVTYQWDLKGSSESRREPIGILLPDLLCPNGLPQYGPLQGDGGPQTPYAPAPLAALNIPCPDNPGGGPCYSAILHAEEQEAYPGNPFDVMLLLSAPGGGMGYVGATLTFTNEAGEDAANLFTVSPPGLNGILDIEGEGSIPLGGAANASWRVTPKTAAAAATGPVRYHVGGILSFRAGSTPVSQVLIDDTIEVLPWPELRSEVFYPAQVFGEDPLSENFDVPEPFSMGLQTEYSIGAPVKELRMEGVAPFLSVIDSSAFGAFTLLAAQAGALRPAPRFPLDLGTITAENRAHTYWDLRPESSGTLANFTFAYVFQDNYGCHRILESAPGGTHDLIHVVQLDAPEDDRLPDFLANDIPDADRTPDTIHASDGAVLPIATATNVLLTPQGKQARIAYALTAEMPSGWGYVKVENPVSGDYAVGYVRRADGTLLPPENAWTTRRTVRIGGGAVQEESHLHLIDYNGAGTYAIQFSSLTETNSIPVANAGPDQTNAYLNQPILLDGTASADADGDPLSYRWRITARPVGSAATLLSANAASPTFTPDRRGDYTLELIVNDTYSDSAADFIVIRVINRTPIADAGPDQTVRPRIVVALSGSGSSDNDNDPLSYAWMFLTRPSGSTATLSSLTAATPAFTPDKPGDYSIQLIVNDGYASSLADTVTIRALNTVPLANAGPDQLRRVTQTVTLDGSASTDADADALAYTWSFTARPAGSQATLNGASTMAPTFLIDLPGEYLLRLVVNDGYANSDLDTVVIRTENSPPVANAGPDGQGRVGENVTLDGRASSDVDKDPLSYAWRFTTRPEGSAAALNNPAAPQPGFILDAPGVFVLELIVTDGAAESTPDTVTITTRNSPPIADAGTDQGRRVNESVMLDGNGSSDVDGDALSFTWTFLERPANSVTSFDDHNAPAPQFVIDVPGEYVVRLVVNDGQVDSDPDEVIVTTQNSVPIANAGSDQTAPVGARIQLDGSKSSDADDDELTYAWSFVSKPASSTTTLANPSSVNPEFELDIPGAYIIRLVVNDGQLNSAPDTVIVSTQNSPPVAHAGSNQTRRVGETATLDASKSTDVDKDTLRFAWSFASKPEGSTADIPNPASVNTGFVVDAPGSYLLQLVVSDGKLDSDPAFVTISTVNSPPVPDPGGNQTQQVGSKVTLDGSASIDPDNNELTFRWSFTARPTGSKAVLNDTNSVNPWFIIDLPGTYVVQLIVNDGLLDAAPVTVTISTVNSAPVANAGPDQTVRVGDMVELDGTDTIDVDGDEITYAWSFTTRPLASATNLSNANTIRPTFVVDVPGAYVVQLFASDGKLYSQPDTVTISTENSAPVANAGPDQTRLLGQTVTLDGRKSADPDGDPLTYQWSFTSRPSGSTAALNDPAAATPAFRIDKNGSYILQLVVSDGKRSADPDTVVVSTLNSRPIANAGLDLAVTEGDLTTLDGRQSSDPDGDALTFRWSFTSAPAGTTPAFNNPTLNQPAFTPNTPGQYVAQLIVNDGALDSNPDALTIYVDPAGGCLNPPGTPAVISATDGDYPDRVAVQWSAVTGATAYRLYRSGSADPATAQPISDWIPGTAFDDLTAPAPLVEQPPACGCGAQPTTTFVYQNYWVQARSKENCNSEFSFSDVGYRGQEPTKGLSLWEQLPRLLDAPVSIPVPALPDIFLDHQTRRITPGSALFLRLTSPGEPIASIWGAVASGNWESNEVQWISAAPDDARDGWAAYYPQAPWPVGAIIAMTAGATTASGKNLDPVTFFFEVGDPDEANEPVWQPPYDELDASYMDPQQETNEEISVLHVDGRLTPESDTPTGPHYLLAPRAAFSTPQRVWLPLPEGLTADAAAIEFLFDEGEVSVWRPSEQIARWMIPGSLLALSMPEGHYIGFLVTHGGEVRIAPMPQTTPPEIASFAVAPLGDLLLLALTLGAMGWAARKRAGYKP